MTSDLLTVKLEKLTYGGDALGQLSDGRAVFVPFALPGETVSIRSWKKNPAMSALNWLRCWNPHRIGFCQDAFILEYAGDVITSICPIQPN